MDDGLRKELCSRMMIAHGSRKCCSTWFGSSMLKVGTREQACWSSQTMMVGKKVVGRPASREKEVGNRQLFAIMVLREGVLLTQW